MSTYHRVKENNKIVAICKLGTAEYMYYVRRNEAYIIHLFDADKGTKFLFMDLMLIWRFSWPDEDIAVNYQNEQTFKQGYQEIVDAVAKRDPRSLIFKVNPSSNFSNDHEVNCVDQTRFKLLGDRYSSNGGFRTIFCCSGCNKFYAFSKAEVEQMIKPSILLLEDYSKDFLVKIIERIYPYPNV